MRWVLKRWWFWAGAGFMLVAIVAGYLLIPVAEGGISQTSCDKIQLGWTAKQVHDFFGDCDIGGSGFVVDVRDTDGIDLFWLTSWADEDLNAINVYFHNGRVSEKRFIPSQLSFLERIRNRIQRRLAMWP
jgi:hypothetical protein